MIKRCIHLADIHIRTYRMHDICKDSFNDLIKKVKDRAEGYKREELRIVVVGDVVHQKITISNEQIMLTSKLLKELSNIAPVILVAGNHDLLANNKDRMDSLTPIVEFLSDQDITYYKESKCYLDDNIVWCNYSVFEDNERPDIESAREEHGDDKKYVGLFHAPINEAKTDTGFEFEGMTNKTVFEGCDVVMMGDIHAHQELNHNGIKLVYSGSLFQNNYGEVVEGHGFVLWDMDSLEYEFVEVDNSYGFYTVEVSSINDIEEDKEVLKNAGTR